MNGKAASWTAGAVVLALVLLVGSWFGLISPKLAETAEIVAETESVQAHNDVLLIQNAKLASDFAKLDDYRQEIAAVAEKLPGDARLEELTRTLEELTSSHELMIVNLAPSTPVAVPSTKVDDPAAQRPAAPGSSGSEESDGESEDEGSEEPTSPTAADLEGTFRGAFPQLPKVKIRGLYAIPLSVTVVGDPAGVRELVEDLQTQLDRTFLVTSLSFLTQDEAEESNGRPETKDGDVEAIISGYVYVLRDLERMLADVEAQQEPVVPVDPDELPSSNRNPFPKLSSGSSGSSSSDEG